MEKRPAGSKQASPKKPASPTKPKASELDVTAHAGDTLRPREESPSLGGGEVFTAPSDDDVDAAAASFLCDESPAPEPVRKPAGKPKSDAPRVPDSPSNADLGQTAAFDGKGDVNAGPAKKEPRDADMERTAAFGDEPDESQPSTAKSRPEKTRAPAAPGKVTRQPGESAHDESAHDGSAHDGSAHGESARDESAQESDNSESLEGTAVFRKESVARPPAASRPAATRVPSAGGKSVTRRPDDSGEATESSKSQSKSTVLGEYRLIKKLGQGGMGSVYLAHQESLDRQVALKVLSRDLARKDAFVKRFKREAQLMAKLDHPNILRCFGAGEAAGNHYLSMEFVEGGSLEGWLKKLGKFSIEDALHVTIACARALEHAHEIKLVHRDIKPDNLLLTKKGVVKLADLGLAKATDDDMGLTKTGTGAGTPLYMAPEQARDVKHVDHRSDIYSVGCMLYCFVTGQVPFTGETLIEVIDAKQKGKFTSARRLNEDVPTRLDLIIDKMVAANPNSRYQTCTELLKDLEDLGLASERLSFLDQPASSSGKATMKPQVKTTQQPGAGPIQTTASSQGSNTRKTQEAKADVADGWYLVLPLPGGKTMNQKMTPAEFTTLVKSGVLTADSEVSRTPSGARRAAASYPEINKVIQALTGKQKVDQKTQKYRELYAQIDEEATRGKRYKWFKGLGKKLGRSAGLLVWLALIAALIGGGGYLVYWLMMKYGG